MTDHQLWEKIKQIVEQEVICNWNAEVVNGGSVAQLIMNLLEEVKHDGHV